MSQESTLTIDSPQAQPVNVIELVSCTNSAIAGVSVYSSRAEIKRCFTLNIKEGRNRVSISGLPKVLIRDSVRWVEHDQTDRTTRNSSYSCLELV